MIEISEQGKPLDEVLDEKRLAKARRRKRLWFATGGAAAAALVVAGGLSVLDGDNNEAGSNSVLDSVPTVSTDTTSTSPESAPTSSVAELPTTTAAAIIATTTEIPTTISTTTTLPPTTTTTTTSTTTTTTTTLPPPTTLPTTTAPPPPPTAPPRVLADPSDPTYGEIACTDTYAVLRRNMTFYGTEDFLNENCGLALPEGWLSQINAEFFGGLDNLERLSIGQTFALNELYVPDEILPLLEVKQQTSPSQQSPGSNQTTAPNSQQSLKERCSTVLGGSWGPLPAEGMLAYFSEFGPEFEANNDYLLAVMSSTFGLDSSPACIPRIEITRSNLPRN